MLTNIPPMTFRTWEGWNSEGEREGGREEGGGKEGGKEGKQGGREGGRKEGREGEREEGREYPFTGTQLRSTLIRATLATRVHCTTCEHYACSPYLMVVLKKRHLDVHPHKLTQVSVSIGVLSTEH